MLRTFVKIGGQLTRISKQTGIARIVRSEISQNPLSISRLSRNFCDKDRNPNGNTNLKAGFDKFQRKKKPVESRDTSKDKEAKVEKTGEENRDSEQLFKDGENEKGNNEGRGRIYENIDELKREIEKELENSEKAQSMKSKGDPKLLEKTFFNADKENGGEKKKNNKPKEESPKFKTLEELKESIEKEMKLQIEANQKKKKSKDKKEKEENSFDFWKKNIENGLGKENKSESSFFLERK